MGKGGGGSAPPPPSDQTVTQTNLPDYAEPYFRSLMQRGQAESRRGYQPYRRKRMADLSRDTYEAFTGIRNVQRRGDPEALKRGIGFATQTGQRDVQYNPASFQGGDFRQEAQSYMDPYIQNVLDVQQDRATRRFNEQGIARDAAAVQAGAFGGTRQAVQESLAQRDLNEQLAQAEAEGLSQAYAQAGQLFDRDRAARLQAEGMTDASQQQLEQFRQAQSQMGLQAGQALADMGQAQQAMDLERQRARLGVGSAREQRRQSQLDMAYQDFVNQRDFRRQQLNFMSGLLRGVPVSAQSEVTTYQAPPSATSQLLGLGIGGLGLAREMGAI